jgi:hypothetical protein
MPVSVKRLETIEQDENRSDTYTLANRGRHQSCRYGPVDLVGSIELFSDRLEEYGDSNQVGEGDTVGGVKRNDGTAERPADQDLGLVYSPHSGGGHVGRQ